MLLFMKYTARFSNSKLSWLFEFISKNQINTGDYLAFEFLIATEAIEDTGDSGMKEFAESYAFYDRFRIEKKVFCGENECLITLIHCD